MKGILGGRAAWTAAAAVGAILAAGPASGADSPPAPAMAPAETCAVIKETKIQGNACKALVLNGCTHEIDLNVHYWVSLRQTVILPVQAEGPAYEVRDAGTAKADEKGTLAPGESRWFVHTSPGKGVEVAKCKVGFDYVYHPK